MSKVQKEKDTYPGTILFDSYRNLHLINPTQIVCPECKQPIDIPWMKIVKTP